ncbi:H-type lectin domain-containing protein [Streptomyces sp. NPDC087228]|uniref:H-type lectin domain-containing protein n=1 Tax=Streptomyces sp. NPDC087228 TaxID=3365772 RepID=UPI003830A20E
MAVPATLWQPGMRITADRLAAKDYQSGTVLVSFTNATSHTRTVAFPVPFPVTPTVTVGVQSGASATARWASRAYEVTPTGFTMFCFVTDAANAPVSWSSVPVAWTARMPT